MALQLLDSGTRRRVPEPYRAVSGARRAPHSILRECDHIDQICVTHQFLGGGNAIQGQYFFPADVGVLGVIYLYGAFGCVLFAVQFVFLFKATRGLPKGAYTPLFDALRGALFYTALSSLANGTFVFAAGLTLVWIAILQACTWRIREVHAVAARGKAHAWSAVQVLHPAR